jgi:hypothetical protein
MSVCESADTYLPCGPKLRILFAPVHNKDVRLLSKKRGVWMCNLNKRRPVLFSKKPLAACAFFASIISLSRARLKLAVQI